MRPIFFEEQTLLKEHFDIVIPDCSWYGRGEIYQFNSKGQKYKIGQLRAVNQRIVYKALRKELSKPVMHENLQKSYLKKNHESLTYLKYLLKQYKNHKIVLLDSSGKDSQVARHLLKESGVEFESVYVNSGMETHHSYLYAKENCDKIISHPFGFFNWVKTEPLMSVLRRNCCDEFQESVCFNYYDSNEKIIFVTGLRKEESIKREKYEYVIQHSLWSKEQKQNWQMINPAIDFNYEDIWMTVLNFDLYVSELYRLGLNRVGCHPCPFTSPYSRVLHTLVLETYDRRWKKILKERFIEEWSWTALNCTIDEYVNGAWAKAKKVRTEVNEEVLNEFIEHTKLDKDIAVSYFNQTCHCCSKKLKATEIGLSMKMLGRSSYRLCVSCLAKQLQVSAAELKDSIKTYKNEGCSLF